MNWLSVLCLTHPIQIQIPTYLHFSQQANAMKTQTVTKPQTNPNKVNNLHSSAAHKASLEQCDLGIIEEVFPCVRPADVASLCSLRMWLQACVNVEEVHALWTL